MMQQIDRLQEKVKGLPDAPGVYLFRDARGHVLYIGKALSLRKRVGSYFTEAPDTPERPLIRPMVEQIADLEFILTENELEALILESNLIKSHKPRYNIALKDDKHYPFLKLDLNDPFPWVQVVRRIKDDGALYYGPYVPSTAMWDVLALVNKTIPLRKCRSIKGRRLCLEYHLGRCVGPCEGLIGESAYGELVDQARLLLDGKDQELTKRLEEQMQQAAETLEYERAAKHRDQIASLRQVFERQRIISPRGEDQDVFGLAAEGGEAQVQLFLIRRGRLIGRETFTFELKAETMSEVLSAVLKQFYLGARDIPREILLSEPLEDAPLIAAWLTSRANRRVNLLVPRRGRKMRLIQMALRNAQEALALSLRSSQSREAALKELQAVLDSRPRPGGSRPTTSRISRGRWRSAPRWSGRMASPKNRPISATRSRRWRGRTTSPCWPKWCDGGCTRQRRCRFPTSCCSTAAAVSSTPRSAWRGNWGCIRFRW